MLTTTAFEEHLAATGLWPPEGRVLVGYSGGADSACLVQLLASTGHDIVAAYLHHGMREEADKEQELCAAFCESLKVQFVSGRADVPAISKEQKVGLEEAGRIARYTFLRQAANQLGCVRIATAHTRTDHTETVLLHVIRGSGRRGLGGIAEQSGDIIRPLLPFDREEIRAYCDQEGLWYFDDPANVDPRFARSRLRKDVFPVLKELNPAVNEAIARLAGIMREEDVFLDGAAAGALERLEVALNGPLGFLARDVEIGLDLPHLRLLPPDLLRRGLRLCFETLGGELDFAKTEILLRGVLEHTSGSVTSEGGEVVGEWTSQELAIRRLEPTKEFEIESTIPGQIDGLDLGWLIELFDEPYSDQVSERMAMIAFIDKDAIRGTVLARSIKPGDRMQPLGFEGRRKISDILGESGLTVAARRRLPILADENGPFWVPGISLDDRIRVVSTTKNVLKLVIGPAQRQ